MFVAIVAFCTALATEQPNMKECVWVEDTENRFQTHGSCAARTNSLLKDGDVHLHASDSLFSEYLYKGQLAYATYCINERELKSFYNHWNIESEDVPQET